MKVSVIVPVYNPGEHFDECVESLLGQTMALVAVTAGMFAVGAYLGRNLAYQWGWLLFIAAFVCLIGMNVAAQRSEGLAVTLLFGFGVLVGLATAPTLSYYTSADPQAVWQAGGRRRCSSPGSGPPATRRVVTSRRSPASSSGR